ncbi:MAG: N-acetylmuramoyl-L-alanine amidase [Candidatus Muiribacteriota bacterium]
MGQKKSVLLILVLLASLVFSYDTIQVIVNEITFTGMIDNGVVYLPVPEICNHFNIRYGYFPDTGIIAINYNNKMISTVVGQREVIINNEIAQLETPPVVIERKVYLPVKFFTKFIDMRVSWQPEEFQKKATIEKLVYRETELGLNLFVLADKSFSKNEYIISREKDTLILTFPNTNISDSDTYLEYPDKFIQGININNEDNRGTVIINFVQNFEIEAGPVVNPTGLLVRATQKIASNDFPENIIIPAAPLDTQELEKLYSDEFSKEIPDENTVEVEVAVIAKDDFKLKSDKLELTYNADLLTGIISDTEELEKSDFELNFQQLPNIQDSFIENIDDIILDQKAIDPGTAERDFLNEKKIVIDPGHGGDDNGIVKFGVFEKDINLALSRKIYRKLIEKGAVVFLTRSGNSSVSDENRAFTGNSNKADLFVSVHCGASLNPQIKGFSIFHYSDPVLESRKDTIASNKGVQDEISAEKILMELKRIAVIEESRKFGKILSSHIVDDLGFVERMFNSGNFQILRDLSMPAVILETNMITNSEISALLREDSVQEKIADTIVKACERYFAAGAEL